MSPLFLSLAVLLTITGRTSGVSQQVQSKALHDFLFTDYDSNLLPKCTTGSNVTVSLDIALRQIVDVNEREQVMTMNIWMRMNWNDCRFSWDPTAYNNASSLTVSFGDVWVPDITLYDSAAEEVMFPGMELYKATISSTGTVTYNFPTVVKSVCRVNVRYFPFDTQRCAMQFGSWSFHGLDLDLVNRNPQGDIANFIANSEWDVKELPVERHVLYYGCCVEPYPDVTFYIVMKRRAAFYVLTMIFPCILTSIVASLVFILPVESGEKISLEITVLLSLAVFLLLVSESLPPSSDNFPILGEYFASAMALVSLSLLMTIIVLNVAYRGTNRRRVPRLLKIIFFDYLGRFLCTKSNKVHHRDTADSDRGNSLLLDNIPLPTNTKLSDTIPSEDISDESVEINENDSNKSEWAKKSIRNGLKLSDRLPGLNLPDPIFMLLKEQTRYLRNIDTMVGEHQTESDINAEWKDLSDILDRLFFIIYILVTLTTTLAHLLQST